MNALSEKHRILMENLDFLVSMGEHPDRIADRLGVKTKTVEKWIHDRKAS